MKHMKSHYEGGGSESHAS